MKRICLALLALAFASPAHAGNIADCEILLVEVIKDEDANGQAQVVTYGPAMDFIASVYDDEPGHITHVAKTPISALMCQRNDVIPVEDDYALMATGVPFALSQDFDSGTTDSLTIYWKDDKFNYVHKGYPLSEETETKLAQRLATFTERVLAAKAETPKAEDE